MINRAEKVQFSTRGENEDDAPPDFVLTFRSPDLVARFRKQDFPEIDLQHYVVARHRDLGFTEAKGPFSRGPDVCLKRGRKTVWAEVELRPNDYLAHGHAEDPAFEKVSLLIIPMQRPPTAALLARLPAEIIYIDPASFLPWWADYRRQRRARPDPKRELAKWISARRERQTEVQVYPCLKCRRTSVFEVPQPEHGFRDSEDVARLTCTCGEELAIVTGLYDVRPVAAVDGLVERRSIVGVNVETVVREVRRQLEPAKRKDAKARTSTGRATKRHRPKPRR